MTKRSAQEDKLLNGHHTSAVQCLPYSALLRLNVVNVLTVLYVEKSIFKPTLVIHVNAS